MSYELQLLDCNCNDCKFLVRDFDRVKQRLIEINEERKRVFDIKKQKLLDSGDPATIRIAEKMVFQPDSKLNQGAGHCSKFDKLVDFIPATCQIHTQDCFQHRKDASTT